MASHLPTPAPTPPPPSTRPSISAEINAATRKQHTELNRLIIDRLPLALPPHALNPALIGEGLSAFAQIFFVFETLWRSCEVLHKQWELHEPDSARPPHLANVPDWLVTLRPEGLDRTSRLERDIAYIRYTASGLSGPLQSARLSPQEEAFTQRIREKPHILVAYAWVMYMAIFSGGRWIRTQLATAGPEFWGTIGILNADEKGDLPITRGTSGFTFLCFDGDEDGEDIRREFKSRLSKAETLLTAQERQEVFEEAQRVFELCIALVHELDRLVRRQKAWHMVWSMTLLAVVVIGFAWLYWTYLYPYLGR